MGQKYYRHEAYTRDGPHDSAVITDVGTDWIEFQVPYGWTYGTPMISTGAKHCRLPITKFSQRYPYRVPQENF